VQFRVLHQLYSIKEVIITALETKLCRFFMLHSKKNASQISLDKIHAIGYLHSFNLPLFAVNWVDLQLGLI